MMFVEDIKKTMTLQAPIDKVWQTVSTAKGIESWFMPNDFEAKVGHEFHLQSPFGPSPCKVIDLSEPHHLTFSWDTDGWIVTFELREVSEGKTEFTLLHSGWKDAVVSKVNEDSAVVRERMNHGWDDIVHNRLRAVVEGN